MSAVEVGNHYYYKDKPMIFKYVTDQYRELVIDGVAAAKNCGLAMVTPISAGEDYELWELHVWTEIRDGNEAMIEVRDIDPDEVLTEGSPGMSYGAPDASTHLVNEPTTFVPYQEEWPVIGTLWKLELEDGSVRRVVCNNHMHASEMLKKFGVFLMSDDGVTVSRHPLGVNQATAATLKASVPLLESAT